MRESQDAEFRRVLLVEDDFETRQALKEFLTDNGYEVVTAAEGADAFRKLKEGAPPDVILLDLRMPGMNGWEFRALQKQDPRFGQTPVIVMSADDTPQAAAVDAAWFLPKPLEPPKLLEALSSVAQAQQKRQREASHLAQGYADRMAAVGTLAAGAAHEINNPLSYLISNLNFVDEKIAEALAACAPASPSGEAQPQEVLHALRELLSETTEAIAECREGAHRIRDVVQSLRLFSRRDEQALAPVNLEQVLDDALRVVGNELKHRAKVVRNYGPVAQVEANSFRLGQVFVNLFLNAAQAFPEGATDRNELRVTLRMSRPDQVEVEVADTGQGIPKDIQSRIFEPFFTTKPFVGPGLGLAVCVGVVRALNGELTVESEPGKGATFRVFLPAHGAQR